MMWKTYFGFICLFLNCLFTIYQSAVLAGLEYADFFPFRYVIPLPHEKECPGYDTKLHLILKLQFWRSRECGVALHCYYSKVHSDPD